ncbi:MAG: transcription antitermination factor NusB [Aeromicrobium sp.]|uniref:transcription antitermination factor NusB n=1 Tax=Aeromicrobium sp. TaxID=1871063 RepID=UPI0025C50014|nr:transcription antitermination factor NusB [Aeromicrobium sp.]MCK5891236.1 transcription antitermination factor NusB [Aeromicrobium sp.]MDF1705588.1 transcription antitermination factor NusB [Aeromicrobium sp.]
MGARTKYRKRALDILFESELQSLSMGGSLVERLVTNHPPINAYTVTLVEGVAEHQARIDELLTEHARGWTLDRMPGVDRNLLRLGTYEILFADDVPDAVAVSEAVDLARELSTDDSPSFVAGVLGAIIEGKAKQDA